jgi:Domain of unknown function (DUF4105)
MNLTKAGRRGTRPFWLSALRAIGLTFLWFVVALLTLWALAALYVDIRIPWLRIPAASVYALCVIGILFTVKPGFRAISCLAGFCIVLMWWLSLRPPSIGNWRADVSRTASAEIDGDRVTIHNLRNCDYSTETEYKNCWSDRTVDLSRIRGVDLFLTNWGPRWISHPILSFDFGDNGHIAFSIEARYKPDQAYSAVLGFFRQYELIFIPADERDVIRLRTNYRKGEEVSLYRINLPADNARSMFMTYIRYLNDLKERPEWYNALTRNCTTAIDKKVAADVANPGRRNYQTFLNGTLDEMLYERGRLVTGGLPFPELKAREHINEAAREANQSLDFSRLVRVGRVGF